MHSWIPDWLFFPLAAILLAWYIKSIIKDAVTESLRESGLDSVNLEQSIKDAVHGDTSWKDSSDEHFIGE